LTCGNVAPHLASVSATEGSWQPLVNRGLGEAYNVKHTDGSEETVQADDYFREGDFTVFTTMSRETARPPRKVRVSSIRTGGIDRIDPV